MDEERFAGYDAALREGLASGISVYELSLLEGMPSKSTVYRHVAEGKVSARPSDLPMGARLKKRRKSRTYEYGGSYASKEGRQYEDFLAEARRNPGLFPPSSTSSAPRSTPPGPCSSCG